MAELNSVSVVMPVYNEGEILESTVREYYKAVAALAPDFEFIIVYDHSTDNTGEVVTRLAAELPKIKVITPEKKGGHGKAIMIGYAAASKYWVFQTDSDNQCDPADLRRLWEQKDGCALVLGYRKTRHDPLPRLILTKIVATSLFLLFATHIRDANCPFRLMNRLQLQALLGKIPPDAIAPNIMLSVLFAKKRMKLEEIAVTHLPRKTGKVSISGLSLVKSSLKGLEQLLRFRPGLA